MQSLLHSSRSCILSVKLRKKDVGMTSAKRTSKEKLLQKCATCETLNVFFMRDRDHKAH